MQQAHFDTSEICRLHGVRYAVFSPGSRNASLSISFASNPGIKSFTIIDERSAGFIALGIAQQTNSPIVLCCTSGTALLNYGPAIAEAFYQEIPLIVLSADRPPEWIDQWDGQTIRQQNAFSNFVKVFYQLPVDLSHADAKWEYQRKLSEGIIRSLHDIKGPVHLNIPFREPFYPEKNQTLTFSNDLRQKEIFQNTLTISDQQKTELQEKWQSAQRKLIILGQGWPTVTQIECISGISNSQNIPVLNDIISNGHPIENIIQHQDLFLQKKETRKSLKPDLVLSFGKSLISKNLKLFLRHIKADHWHVSPHLHLEDPFQSLTTLIKTSPEGFLRSLKNNKAQDGSYLKKWKTIDQKSKEILNTLDEVAYSEFVAFKEVMRSLPEGTDLHLANSMPVRYANFIQDLPSDSRVYANRGSSGIDGTNGTAVGHALTTDRKIVVLSGDLSFLYDRNAFFHSYDLSNLVFIVFNNFGGGIFDLIPGPSNTGNDMKEKHFTTPHQKDLKYAALDAGFAYSKANDLVTLDLALSGIFTSGSKPKLLEIQTDPKTNKSVYLEIKKLINE